MNLYYKKLANGNALTEDESYNLLESIIKEEYNPTQVIAILAFFIHRTIEVQELNGFRKAIIDYCNPVVLDKVAMDVCGTGGDQKNTFNISTLSALVLAAADIPVAKHGNYGSTSISGSSDILNYFGYKFKTKSVEVNEDLNEFNFCFIHAPLFHPALKKVAIPRKEIGLRTFFNILGPLVNPSNIASKYVGVFNLETARLYNYHLQNSSLNYSIVHSMDGYDEVSLTSPFKIYTNTKEELINPEDLKLNRISAKSLNAGNTIKEAATIFVSILENTSTFEQKEVVLVNSALAYCCHTQKNDFQTAYEICKEVIESKKAIKLFKTLILN